MTENHDLNTPQEGSSDWHIPLNDNFQKLDDKVEIRDEESNRDNYTPKSGAKFLSTDTENEFVGDGSQWLRLASSGRRPSFGRVQSSEIIAERYLANLADQNQQARTNRPLVSTDNRTVYVDPNEGDDTVATEDVTRSNPLRTLNVALMRVPMIVQHEWVIKLEDGVYDSVSALSGPVMTLSGWQTSGVLPQFRIEGNQSNPRNVVIDAHMGLAVSSPEIDDEPNAVINSLQFNGQLNNKAGTLSVGNCVFTGSVSGAHAALRGKGGATTHFTNCTFEDGLDYVAFLANPGSDVLLTRCDGAVSEYTFRMQGGARGIVRINNDPIGRKGQYILKNGGVFIDYAGNPRDRYTQLVDDFNDDRWSDNRLSTSVLAHRPVWKDTGGGIDARGGVLRFPAGHNSSQYTELEDEHSNMPNSVTFDYQLQSSPSSGGFHVHFMHNDNGGYYRTRLSPGGIALDRSISGSSRNGIISGSRSDDTSWHTVEVTRTESGNWDLYEDGRHKGGTSDTAIPSRGSSDWAVALENSFDAEVHFDNLRLGNFTA